MRQRNSGGYFCKQLFSKVNSRVLAHAHTHRHTQIKLITWKSSHSCQWVCCEKHSIRSAHGILTFCLHLHTLPSLLENGRLFLDVKWWLSLKISLSCGCTVYVNQLKPQPRSSMSTLQDPALSAQNLMQLWQQLGAGAPFQPKELLYTASGCSVHHHFLKRSPDPVLG